MKHHVLGSLTAALVMSSFGAPLASHAQQVDETDHLSPSEASDIPEMPPDESTELAANATVHPEQLGSGSSETGSSSPLNQSALPAQSSAPEPRVETLRLTNLVNEDSLTVIQAHSFDNRQAATLYVHNLPILTFLGNELPTLAGTKALDRVASETGADPVIRATEISAQLEQFYQAGGDANQIAVRWDAEHEQYLVTLSSETLVAVNHNTILPDTTEDPATDALHIANRLRRLLGDVPPIEEIEGAPQPNPQDTLIVTSVLTGMASWYGPGFNGRRSASGEVFNQNALTAAHRNLPFGTEVRVTNLGNGRQVIVRINDRGPYAHGRVLDLSAGAAQAIGLMSSGVGMVQLEVLGRP